MKNKILLLALFVSGGQLFAQNAMSIEDCVEYGLENNVEAKNAKLDQEIAKATIKETTGIGLPNISADAKYNSFITRPTSIIPNFVDSTAPPMQIQFGTRYNASLGFTVSQLLFDGSYLVGLKAARTYGELAEKQSNLSNFDLTVNIKKAYLGVLINIERSQLLTKSVAQLDSTLNELQEMYKAGFIEKIDVDRTKVSLNNLKLQKSKVERLEILSNTLLKFQMGMPINEQLILSSKIDDFSIETNSDESYSVSDRPEFQLLEVQQKLNKLNLQNQKIKYAPSLMAFYNFEYSAQRNDFDFFKRGAQYPWFQSEILGLALSIPIFDGGQTHYRVQQAKLNLLKTENTINNLKSGLEVEVATSKMQLQNSVQELNVQKENQELATEVYRVSKEKYKSGVGSNLELITAESSKIEADNNYYNALYNALIAKIDLQKATGKLK